MKKLEREKERVLHFIGFKQAVNAHTLSKEFKVHYHTAELFLLDLEKQGLLKRIKFGHPRYKSWEIINDNKNDNNQIKRN